MVDERRNLILMFLRRLILLFRTNLFSFSKGEFYAIMSAMEKKTTIKLNLNSLAVILYTSDLIPTKEGPLTNDEWYAIEKRIKEAEKLGFKTCIIPESNKKLLKENYNLDIIGVKNVYEAMKAVGLK